MASVSQNRRNASIHLVEEPSPTYDRKWSPMIPEEAWKLDPTTFKVYAALLQFAQSKDTCWPSHKVITDLTGIGQRSVVRAISKLVELGFVEQSPKSVSGLRGVNVYTLKHVTPNWHNVTPNWHDCYAKLAPPLRQIGTGNNSNEEEENASHSPSLVRPENFVENPSPTTSPKPTPRRKKESDSNPDFDQFYAAYPRHTGRKAAATAWRKIDFGAVNFDDLMASLEKQKRNGWVGKDPKFIPHPSTWLNGERWTDEVDDYKDDFRPVITYEDARRTGRPAL